MGPHCPPERQRARVNREKVNLYPCNYHKAHGGQHWLASGIQELKAEILYTYLSLSGAGKPLFCEAMWLGHQTPVRKREENAQVKDPYGREKALQQDWHRQDQAAPDQDAPYSFVQIAKSETQAR